MVVIDLFCFFIIVRLRIRFFSLFCIFLCFSSLCLITSLFFPVLFISLLLSRCLRTLVCLPEGGAHPAPGAQDETQRSLRRENFKQRFKKQFIIKNREQTSSCLRAVCGLVRIGFRSKQKISSHILSLFLCLSLVLSLKKEDRFCWAT